MSEKDQRATLLGKDRDELMAIAASLGGKPGARAKKDDLIEMILQLVAGAEPPKRRGRPPKSAAVESDADADANDIEEPEDAADENEEEDEADNDADEEGDDAVDDSVDESEERNADDDAEMPGRRRRRRGRDRGGERFGERPEEPWSGEPIEVSGVLDLRDEGYGFIRVNGYLPTRDDVYVSVKQTRQFALRRGDVIVGASRPAARNEKNPALLRIDLVNGAEPDAARERRRFDYLTPVYPTTPLSLVEKADAKDLSLRAIEALSPIGKGSRGLVSAPPRTGKSTLLKKLAGAIARNNSDVHVMLLMIDERPEDLSDITDEMSGEVIASPFDRPADEHVSVAELVLERAKRMVEDGSDVVIILDGLTKLARAYNSAYPGNGRVAAGGFDTGSIVPAKRFFGAARNFSEGGSLTIVAALMTDTGSRLDEVVDEEFTGTANVEITLDRSLAERRMYPALRIDATGSRNEEMLYGAKEMAAVAKLRQQLAAKSDQGGPAAGLLDLFERIEATADTAALLAAAAKGK